MMSGISDDKPNGSFFGGMILNDGNDNAKVCWQEYLITKTKWKPATLYFQIKSSGYKLIKKLFIVKHNGPIFLLFIPRQMGELQRRLNGRRRLDQVSVTSWQVLASNLLFSSECLNDK